MRNPTIRDKSMIKAVMEDDWSGIIRMCKEDGVPIPDDPRVMKAGIYKAVQYCTKIPQDVKETAMLKCLALGFNPFIKPYEPEESEGTE